MLFVDAHGAPCKLCCHAFCCFSTHLALFYGSLLLFLSSSNEESPLFLSFSFVLFVQGDWLGFDKPYVVCSVDGTTCLEYGPATLVYCLPYIPVQVNSKGVLADAAQRLKSPPALFVCFFQAVVDNTRGLGAGNLHSCIPCDEHGWLDYAMFAGRVSVSGLRAAMKNVSLCVRVSLLSVRVSSLANEISLSMLRFVYWSCC